MEEESIESLKKELETLKEAHGLLLAELDMLLFDSLTGLQRRDVFESEMRSFFDSRKRGPNGIERRADAVEEEDFCFVMFDLDNFKQYNDDPKYGHAVGDIVLKSVATVIRDYTRREVDEVCRWGGDEIAAKIKISNLEEAVVKANFIREKIEQIKIPGYPEIKPTVSVGVFSSEGFNDFDTFFDSTDKELYKSKERGRNRVSPSLEELNSEAK